MKKLFIILLSLVRVTKREGKGCWVNAKTGMVIHMSDEPDYNKKHSLGEIIRGWPNQWLVVYQDITTEDKWVVLEANNREQLKKATDAAGETVNWNGNWRDLHVIKR